MKKVLLWLVVMLGVCACFSVPAFAQDKPSILIVAAESGEGRLTQIVDDTFMQKMTERGYNVGSCFVTQVTPEVLAKFNVVVLVREAIEGDPVGDYEAWLEVSDMLDEYVKNGGGLFVGHSEVYGMACVSLNNFMKRYDVKFSFNQITEKDKNRLSQMPIDPSSKLALINLLPSPLTQNMSSLWIPIFGGHGPQTLTIDAGADWQVIGEGSRTASSTLYSDRIENAFSVEENPVFIVSRQLGKGRIVVFPSGQPYWIIGGYHRRWSEGWLFNQGEGQGLQFYINCFDWLGAPTLASGTYGGFTKNMQDTLFPPIGAEATSSFTIVPPEKQDLSGNAYRCLIGARTTLTGGDSTVAEYAAAAKQAGYDVLVLAEDYRKLDEETWQGLQEECAHQSDEELLVIAGFELIDDEGNRVVCFNLTNFPELPLAYGIPHILEYIMLKPGRWTTVYATPKHNKNHPWNFGGYNSIEVYSYIGNVLKEDALDWYKELEASDFKLNPVVIHRITSANQIKNLSGYDFYVIADSLNEVSASIENNRHRSFVSNGPRITGFWLEGHGVTDDHYEGLWYEWMPGDDVKVHIAVEADSPIQKVNLLTGSELVASFQPLSKTFSTKYDLVISEDYNLLVEVTDADGNTATSYSYPFRCRDFWGHLGGDRMNTYCQIWKQDPKGSLWIRDHRMDAFGFISFGTGWGDTLTLLSSIPSGDISPLGIETGPGMGGLGRLGVVPLMRTTSGDEISVSQQRRSYALRSRDCQIMEAVCDTKHAPEGTGAPVATIEGETIQPASSSVVPTELIDFDATYTMFRWRPYAPVCIIADTRIVAKKDFTLKDIDGLEVRLVTAPMKTNQWLRYYTYVDPDGAVHDVRTAFEKGNVNAKDLELGRHGFAALWPDAYGSVALYALDENTYSVDIGGSPFGIDINIGFNNPSREIKKGDVIEAKVLIMGSAGNESDSSPFRDFYDAFGFDGSTDYSIDASEGTVTNSIYTLDVDADEFGSVLKLGSSMIPVDLPIVVNEVNGNWQAGIVDLAGKAVDIGGVYDDRLYIARDIAAGADIYAGNLVLCDDEDVVVQFDPQKMALYVHNPKTQAVSCRVYSPKEVAGVYSFDTTVELAAGATQEISVK